VLLLLCSLSKTCEHFKNTLLYEIENIYLKKVQMDLSSKELNELKTSRDDLIERGKMSNNENKK